MVLWEWFLFQLVRTTSKFSAGSKLTTWSLEADFLVLITGRTPHGRIAGHTVYLATDFRVLPLAPSSPTSLIHHPVEKHLLGLVERHLATGVFWFSYTWDMTNRLQAQPNSNEKPMWSTVSPIVFTGLLILVLKLANNRPTTASSGISTYRPNL